MITLIAHAAAEPHSHFDPVLIAVVAAVAWLALLATRRRGRA